MIIPIYSNNNINSNNSNENNNKNGNYIIVSFTTQNNSAKNQKPMVSKGKKLSKKCVKLAPDLVFQAVFINCSSITQCYPCNSFISHKSITQFIIPLSSLRSLEIKATSSWTSRQGCLAMSSLMCPSPVKLKEHKRTHTRLIWDGVWTVLIMKVIWF